MKKYCAGVITGVFLMLTVTVLAETVADVNVVFNRVKLVVNGKLTDTPTMLYEGRTYIELRGVAEAFGSSLEWNGTTNTATLTSEKAGQDALPTEMKKEENTDTELVGRTYSVGEKIPMKSGWAKLNGVEYLDAPFDKGQKIAIANIEINTTYDNPESEYTSVFDFVWGFEINNKQTGGSWGVVDGDNKAVGLLPIKAGETQSFRISKYILTENIVTGFQFQDPESESYERYTVKLD